MRLIVGMTGAAGAVLGLRLLSELRRHDEVETHLVVSRWARSTIELETGLTAREVTALTDIRRAVTRAPRSRRDRSAPTV